MADSTPKDNNNIQFELSHLSAPGLDVEQLQILRIIKGQEEISSLYSYELLVSLPDSLESVDSLIGARIALQVKQKGKVIRTICGCIMSVNACRYKDTTIKNAKIFYEWVIRPEFAKACYSLNRWVWQKDSSWTWNKKDNKPITAYNDGKTLLEVLIYRWSPTTPVEVTEKAQKAIPVNLLQIRQNDESDYNFFARLLSTWGLGYIWRMEVDSNTNTYHEKIIIFDASEEDSGYGCVEVGAAMSYQENNGKTLWKKNYGIHHSSEPDLQNYCDLPSSDLVNSLHDETWDQFSKLESNYRNRVIDRYKSTHDNSFSCHGKFTLKDSSVKQETLEQAAQILLGNKIKWDTSNTYGMCNVADSFLITGLTIDAADREWKAIIRGRKSQGNLGIGIFPRPVHLNDHPDICDDDLITADAYPEPRMRIFMAVVESDSLPDGVEKDTPLHGRNLCCVREIFTKNSANESTSLRLWVEMASPHADENSGILARPRKGNVLVCLDRGDMSIPLALGALWRRNEGYTDTPEKADKRTPFAQLKQMDRQKREEKSEDLVDMSALTLRNRKQTVIDSNPKDQKVEEEDVITRPISVHKLAAKPLNFSQIQLVSRWNTVSPVRQKPEFDKRYVDSAKGETAAGFVTASSSSASYAGVINTNAEQSELNRPITRPHFEGINMYSNSDLLMQSADHQLINAGGEIVLTAAQAITLRVGTSSIKITQAGIEICTKVGTTHNPGAYPAYHRPRTEEDKKREQDLTNHNQEDYAQTINAAGTLPIGGRIWIDFSGVNTQGAYIANAAMNVFSASTLLGTSLTLSDFDAKLLAPETLIIGGAALLDTLSNAMQLIMKGAIDAEIISSGGGSPYNDAIDTSGNKLNIQRTSGGTAWAVQILDWAGGVLEHIGTGGLKILNLASPTGSMIKMNSILMSHTSPIMNVYAPVYNKGQTALAPFGPLAAKATGGNMITAIGKVTKDFKLAAKYTSNKTWDKAIGGYFIGAISAACRVAAAVFLNEVSYFASSIGKDVKALGTNFGEYFFTGFTGFSRVWNALKTNRHTLQNAEVAAENNGANLADQQRNVQDQAQIVDQDNQAINQALQTAILEATAAQNRLTTAITQAQDALQQHGGTQINNPA